MSETMHVFNRRLVRRHRDRAAANLSEFDFLFRESAERLADRLDDIKREFPLALDLGCHTGQMGAAINGRGGIETLIQCDLSPKMAGGTTGGPVLAADEETLPFAEKSLDMVVSNLSLHWVNDLPGALTQIRQSLKPDGLFLGVMLGGETLRELRHSLMEAESRIEGGISPRVSPFADIRDAGDLLQRAGFTLPVLDTEIITVSYPDPMKVLTDLRGMGETNAVEVQRKGMTRRETLLEAARIYQETFASEDGRVPATFELITMTAWSPGPNQPKPLSPGSAETLLAEALGKDPGSNE